MTLAQVEILPASHHRHRSPSFVTMVSVWSSPSIFLGLRLHRQYVIYNSKHSKLDCPALATASSKGDFSFLYEPDSNLLNFLLLSVLYSRRGMLLLKVSMRPNTPPSLYNHPSPCHLAKSGLILISHPNTLLCRIAVGSNTTLFIPGRGPVASS